MGATNIILVLTATTSTPKIRNSATDSSNKYIIIIVINIYGNYLFLFFNFNANNLTLIGNSPPITLSNNIFTQFAFPTGWAKKVYVGPNLNPDGSKIEGSFTSPSDININYINSYFVPITCSSEDVTVTGYNINLFE